MHRHSIVPLSLAFLVISSAASGKELDTLLDHVRLMSESKLSYDALPSGVVKKPVTGLECPARHSAQRVVVTGGGKQLVPWAPKPEAKEHFISAEEHFQAKRLAEAGAEYAAGLAIDPDFGPGWLYGGDVPYASGLYAEALASFRKALELDSTLAEAHRFAADALVRLGRYPEAREEYIQALADDPADPNALEALENLGRRAGFAVERPPAFAPPRAFLGELVSGHVEWVMNAGEAADWLPYVTCKAVWRHEDTFRTRKLGQKSGTPYAWSLAEERECVTSYYSGLLSSAEEKVKETNRQAGRKRAKITEAEILAAAPSLFSHLQQVLAAQQLDGFVLFAVVGPRCPTTLALLPDDAHQAIESYLRSFVVN